MNYVLDSDFLKKGLILYLPFNGNAKDESIFGGKNDGIVNGATLTTDRYGYADRAYQFDGINDVINIPTLNLSSLSEITVTGKFFWEDGVDGLEGIFSNGLTGPLNTFAISVSNTGLRFVVSNGVIQQGYNNRKLVSTNQWYNFSASVRLGNGLLYIEYYLDNNLIFLSSVPSLETNFSYLGQNWRVGYLNNTRYFKGKIDEVRVYNRVLSGAEIAFLSKIR